MRRALLVIGVALAGCQEVTIVDDVDTDFDWSILAGPSDALHSPYVLGAQFALWVRTTKSENLRGWRVDSGDERVVKIGAPTLGSDDDRFSSAVVAMNPGTVELRVVDGGGEVRHRHSVEVRRPDRLDVLAHGPLLIGRDGVVSEQQPWVLRGGTATFLVQYYAANEHLSGHGALATSVSTGMDAHVERSSFLEDRDWLVVEPQTSGDVGLVIGGETARTLPIVAVDEASIDRVALTDPREDDAAEKEWLVTLAETFDAQGRPIYGVEFGFTTDGKAEQGFGDLYRYKHAAKIPVMLEATHGAHADGMLIHSSGGFVSSTNHIGCSTAPGDGGASGELAALIFVGLAFLGSLIGLRRRVVAVSTTTVSRSI